MARRISQILICLLLVGTILGGTVAAQTVKKATPTPTTAAEPEPIAADLDDAEETPDAAEAETAATDTPQGSPMQLTVYNQNLGLVREVRSFDLAEGVNEVRFTDVASQIDPTSVHFASLTAPDTAVLEQNYEYDLVSSRKLLAKYVDQVISVTTQQGSVYTGTLLSAVDNVVLKDDTGIKIVQEEQVLEYAFPSLPGGLITRPTLVWLLDSAQAGAQDVEIAYLTSGINWKADYVIVLAPDDAAMALNGWVTVENRTGATYENAQLKLVAGDIHRAPQNDAIAFAEEKMTVRAAAAPQVEEREFFEYHLYEVQRPVTVRDQQTKQIEFTSTPAVDVDKVYVLPGGMGTFYRPSGNISSPDFYAGAKQKVQVHLRFVNSEESGLGVPLPKGTVRVYKEDIDGSTQLVGEDSIDHTPRDEKMSLYLGDAFDIVGERTQLDFKQLSKRSVEETVQVTVRNHKSEDIQVRVIEQLYRAQDAEVVEASSGYEHLDNNTIEFLVDVPADGEATISYTTVYRW